MGRTPTLRPTVGSLFPPDPSKTQALSTGGLGDKFRGRGALGLSTESCGEGLGAYSWERP